MKRRQLALAVLVLSAAVVPAVAAEAAPKPVTYANCDAVHRDYPHGVARSGAKDKVRGKTKPVTTFAVAPAVYRLNTKSDRDGDGIACEKR